MIENVYKYDSDGIKGERRTDCSGEQGFFEFAGLKYEFYKDWFVERAFYITPDGKRQELPVHAYPMTAMKAIKIHAMNLSGYSP